MSDLEAAIRQRLLLRLQQLSLGGRGPLPTVFANPASASASGDASASGGASGGAIGSGAVMQSASGDAALLSALAERGYHMEDLARLSLAELEPLSQRVGALLGVSKDGGIADDSDSR